MKKLQCPLCGGDIAIEKRVLYSDRPLLFHAGCEQCRWETNRGYAAEKDAWKDAEKFVSLFPPIMRLKPGDLIKIRKIPDNFFVIGIDAEKGVIRAGCTYGYSMSYVPEDVDQWPWEIEQEGGRQD